LSHNLFLVFIAFFDVHGRAGETRQSVISELLEGCGVRDDVARCEDGAPWMTVGS